MLAPIDAKYLSGADHHERDGIAARSVGDEHIDLLARDEQAIERSGALDRNGQLESRVGGLAGHHGTRLDELTVREPGSGHTADHRGGVRERPSREVARQVDRRRAQIALAQLGAGDHVVGNNDVVLRWPSAGAAGGHEGTERREGDQETADDGSSAR